MHIKEKRLRMVLKVNGTFSALSGLTLIAWRPLADLMDANARTLIFIGGGLILFAITVWQAAVREEINRKQVISIIVQDWVWVGASLVVIGFDIWNLSEVAYVLIAIVAVIVGVFASLQMKFLGRKT